MKVNPSSFQVILATDEISSYIIFFYEDIQWSDSTVVGFNAGDMRNSFTVPGTVTSGGSDPDFVRDLDIEGNTGISGLFLYRVDQEFIFDSQGQL